MKQWIVYIILLAAASIYASTDTAIRLAVLAEDVSSEGRALADLLTADLSKAAGVQMVERAEIDRVLAEQKLTAGGLVETASRIQLGRLLKADGLVLIRKDDARQTRVLARMVETKGGFLAGYYQIHDAKSRQCGKMLRPEPCHRNKDFSVRANYGLMSETTVVFLTQ